MALNALIESAYILLAIMATENFCAVLGLLSNLNWEVCSQYICGRELQEFQLETKNSDSTGLLESCRVTITRMV